MTRCVGDSGSLITRVKTVTGCMEHSPSLDVNSHLPVKESSVFYESRSFIACSQEPATGSYAELAESIPYSLIVFI